MSENSPELCGNDPIIAPKWMIDVLHIIDRRLRQSAFPVENYMPFKWGCNVDLPDLVVLETCQSFWGVPFRPLQQSLDIAKGLSASPLEVPRYGLIVVIALQYDRSMQLAPFLIRKICGWTGRHA